MRKSTMEDAYGAYARFYDLDYAGMDADLPVIQQFALRAGSPILELACGTGRVLLPLAREGYQVTGVDVSASMLNEARRKISSQGLESHVTLVQQDMRDLSLNGSFNLALVLSNSFLHLLTLDDQLAALQGVRRHLHPGGLLLLDVFNPDLSRLLDFQGRTTLEKVMIEPETGHRLMKYHSQMADLGQQTIQVTYIVDEMDAEGHVQRTLFPFCLRYLFRYELELLLRHAGFEFEAIYGSYELDDFTGDSQRMIAVARQPA
jgi:ubiquinone/menaquinone biosynthesis C-methylase UbiE